MRGRGGYIPDYDGPSRNIWRLADAVRGFTNDRNRHDETMRSLDLASAKADTDRETLLGRHKIALAQQKRQRWLEEPVDVLTAITESKLPDEKKKALITALQQDPGAKDILSIVAPRQQIFNSYFQAKQNMLNRQSNEKLTRQRQSATAKDTRSAMEKDIDAISQIFGIDKKASYERYQKDKNLPERIRLYNNAVENMDKFLTEDEKAPKIKQLRQAFGIDELMNEPKKKPEVEHPKTIDLVWDTKQMKLVPAQ